MMIPGNSKLDSKNVKEHKHSQKLTS